ncbi:MAG: hypothetical protein KC425_17370 [Anaerolineales bacterium]|nr:hypothetical protein [Anaerolineales bacterium]
MDAIKLRNALFYQVKGLVPRRTQIWLRHQMARRQRAAAAGVWPILETAASPPPNWPGWPDGKQFALVLMHDVELDRGQQRVPQLMALEEAAGFRSSFNFVPERYRVDPELRALLAQRGFEVGVHGLNHDGRLYQSPEIFSERAPKINRYLADWGAVGFCSPASHHNLAWNHALHIAYESSTFDTDPFEPQPDGVQSIFPFWVANAENGRGYVELPYTLPQDFTLFILLRERGIDVWRQKLAWIAAHGGMALVITHPDYMQFDGRSPRYDTYPAAYYADFLAHVQTTYGGQFWHALPREVAAFATRLRGEG